MSDAFKDFEQRLYREIPLAAAIGVKASAIGVDRMELRAPLGPNLNHQRTVFGGSLYSVAVLACWSLINETMRAKQIDFDYIVIQNGAMEYLAPVEGEMTAEAVWGEAADREKFLATLKKRGLARVSLKARVSGSGKLCATLEGRFVAKRLGEH